jgi:hypothetical protein
MAASSALSRRVIVNRPHIVLNFGVFDDHGNSCLTPAQVVNPITAAEHPESLSNSLVQRISGHLNRVFHATEVAA